MQKKKRKKLVPEAVMNQIDNFSDDESAMAIAAAAFAITILEDGGSLHHRRMAKGLRSSLTTTKSEREDNTIKSTDSSTSFQMSSFNEAKDGKSAVSSGAVLSDNFTRKTAESEQQMLDDSTANRKNKEKAMGAKRPSRKTVTFTDTYQNDANSKISESRQEIKTGPEELSTIKPTSLPDEKSWDRYSAVSDKLKGVDAWEKEEIAKENNRYEKRNATIMEWENEKKTKAKLKMEQMERGPEQRQAKAKQEYRDDMSRIDGITYERKRNDESKVKEKTQLTRARKTSTCFCL